MEVPAASALKAADHGFEDIIVELNDDVQLQAYKKPFDEYPAGFIPRMLGAFLVGCGNLIYGKVPSYLKFRAVEVIARVPYHSWSSAVFTLLTMFYSDEKRALELSTVAKFARLASDNETMHVVVISQLARAESKAGVFRYTLVPMFFAFFYFWASYFLYLMKPRWSLELNYLFEQHAYDQYSAFLETRAGELRRKPVHSEFLHWYGRNPKNHFEFFQSVRNDEILHRNRSIREIELIERR